MRGGGPSPRIDRGVEKVRRESERWVGIYNCACQRATRQQYNDSEGEIHIGIIFELQPRLACQVCERLS